MFAKAGDSLSKGPPDTLSTPAYGWKLRTLQKCAAAYAKEALYSASDSGQVDIADVAEPLKCGNA